MRALYRKAIKAILPPGVDIFLLRPLWLAIYKHWYFWKYTPRLKPLVNNVNTNVATTSPPSPQFIVTLTSYGHRVKQTAPYAICSLINQSVQPDRIILWLAYGTKVPRIYSQLIDKGLEIKFCEDIRSYKKLIPALREFPNDVLVTADDDIFHQDSWLKELKNAHEESPGKICFHRAHELSLDENKNVIPYMTWRSCVQMIEYPRRLFPTGVGGILYPPHSLDVRVLDQDMFQRLAPTSDDVWFWAMAKLAKTQYTLVKNICKVSDISTNRDGLYQINTGEGGKNDEQIQAVIKQFPEIMEQVI